VAGVVAGVEVAGGCAGRAGWRAGSGAGGAVLLCGGAPAPGNGRGTGTDWADSETAAAIAIPDVRIHPRITPLIIEVARDVHVIIFMTRRASQEE
jgi:hypothetical protein